MTHFKNAVAAYQQALKSKDLYERKNFHKMARNFTKWHIAEVGGDYLETHLAMVAEATGYFSLADKFERRAIAQWEERYKEMNPISSVILWSATLS